MTKESMNSKSSKQNMKAVWLYSYLTIFCSCFVYKILNLLMMISKTWSWEFYPSSTGGAIDRFYSQNTKQSMNINGLF